MDIFLAKQFQGEMFKSLLFYLNTDASPVSGSEAEQVIPPRCIDYYPRKQDIYT